MASDTCKPMLFSAPMVRAILSGEKTQTRRVRRPRASFKQHERLWVRETWCQYDPMDRRCVVYRADCDDAQLAEERATLREMGFRTHEPWRPSIHMPRWAARIELAITAVRVERLQEIGELDARAEGVQLQGCAFDRRGRCTSDRCAQHRLIRTHTQAFALLWDEINGKREGCSWADNPMVWALSFKRIAA